MFLAGACAGSVSEEVCLPEGELQGNPPPSEQHSQKVAGWVASLGVLLRPRRWVLDLFICSSGEET